MPGRHRYHSRSVGRVIRRATNQYWVPFGSTAALAFSQAGGPAALNLAIASNLSVLYDARVKGATLMRVVGQAFLVSPIVTPAATTIDMATIGLIWDADNLTAAQLDPTDRSIATGGALRRWLWQAHGVMPYNTANTQQGQVQEIRRDFDIRVHRSIRENQETLWFAGGQRFTTATTGTWNAYIAGRALVRVP